MLSSSRGLQGLQARFVKGQMNHARNMSIFSGIKKWHDKRHQALRHDYETDTSTDAIHKAYGQYKTKGGDVDIDTFYSNARVSDQDMNGPLNGTIAIGDEILSAPNGVVYRHIKSSQQHADPEDEIEESYRKYEEIIRNRKSLTQQQKRDLVKAHGMANMQSISVPESSVLRDRALGKEKIQEGPRQLPLFVRAIRAVTNKSKDKAPEAAAAAARRGKKSGLSETLSQHYKLTKPNISLMVMTTAWWGYGLSCMTLENFSAVDFASLSVGTLAMAISASIINQIRETDVDAKMARTAARPLVTGKISIATAKKLVVIYALGGAAILGAVNPYAAGLGLLNIALYGGLYTSLKRKSPLNTEVGAIVGMIPPVMGYLAGTPEGFPLLHDPVSLYWPAAVMFAWQIQHVMLICLRRSEDYNRSGLVMQCLDDPDLQTTRAKGIAWAFTTAAITAIPLAFGWSEIGQIFIVYMWTAYSAMFAIGAFSKKPRMELLKVCLYLGYLFLFITIIFSFTTRKYEEDFSGIQLNKKRKDAPITITV